VQERRQEIIRLEESTRNKAKYLEKLRKKES